MNQCIYLGHVFGEGTVQPELWKIGMVKLIPIPEMKRKLEGVFGLMATIYQRFIPDYGFITAPISDLMKNSTTKFNGLVHARELSNG